MEYKIRKMILSDKKEVLFMMKNFYASDAVYTNGSDEIFENDFENCVNENPYLEGYIFYSGNEILGYAMVAKSFSTEFGRQCIWFEDLYLKSECRGIGIVPSFIEFIKRTYPNALYRLEVETENTHAVHVYTKKGFKQLPYIQMFET